MTLRLRCRGSRNFPHASIHKGRQSQAERDSAGMLGSVPIADAVKLRLASLYVIALATSACGHPATYDGSVPWPPGPWTLNVQDFRPGVVTVTPWTGAKQVRIQCGTSVTFTEGKGGAPSPPWTVVVRNSTGSILLDEDTPDDSHPPQEIDVFASGASMRDAGGSLGFPGAC